ILSFNGLLASFLPLLIVLALCGLISSARLILNTHRPIDIYGGLITGVISQLIATGFISLH
ncbi:MAG: hypothetical protein ABUT20_48805, partial [Bacteroidota bacterium]